MLRHLKRVFIQFSPTDPRSTTARELMQRVGNDKARKSNPECAVEFKVTEATPEGKSFVELQFVDGQEAKLLTAGEGQGHGAGREKGARCGRGGT